LIKKIDKIDISKKRYSDLYLDKPLEIEVGKKYKRKIINEKGKEIVKDFYISEIKILDDGGIIIKSITS